MYINQNINKKEHLYNITNIELIYQGFEIFHLSSKFLSLIFTGFYWGRLCRHNIPLGRQIKYLLKKIFYSS